MRRIDTATHALRSGLCDQRNQKRKLEYGENIAIDQRGAPRCIEDDAHDGQSIECSSCAHRNAIDCNHATA
ncbi:hypothetical protein [Xanthomonas hortorum]|uniref:hypothetical protein n=1 Tax=Xanthomonas hortorum TaxID=56454 RepID=UPI0032E92751